MSLEELEELINNLEISGKSREEVAKSILSSEDMALDEVFWVQTVERDAPFNEEKCPYLDNAISKREILLSRVIGKPYPTYFLDGISDHKHDNYRNEISTPKERKSDYAMYYEKTISERKSKGIEQAVDKKGIIKFGYDKSAERMDGYIETSESELLRAGLDPEKMGLDYDKIKVTSKDLAEADKEQGLTTTEVGGFKGFIKRLLDKFKGKGEK